MCIPQLYMQFQDALFIGARLSVAVVELAMWILIVTLILADPAVPARYEFDGNATKFSIPGFVKEDDCKQAAKDMTAPLERAGFKVSMECKR